MSDCFNDHSVIYCVWKIRIPKWPPKSIKIRQHRKINVDLFMNNPFSIKWDRYQSMLNVQDAWDVLHSNFSQVIDRHAPWKMSKVKGRHQPWISAEPISPFRQRERVWAIFCQTRESADWKTYRQLINISKTLICNAKSTNYKECLKS